jgi:hypothetical protein
MDNKKCDKWYGQLRELRGKHAEFRQAYADALQFAEENPGVRETAFGGCRVLFGEIKGLVLALREDFLPSIKYEKFVNRLILSSDIEENTRFCEKLKEMVSEYNYNKAVKVAKELKASRIPTREQILAQLMKWTPEQFKNVCETQESPRVVIESDKSFDEQVAAMDAHKHYTSTDGDTQEIAYVYRKSDSPFINIPKSQKVKISITDGVVHPAQLNSVSTRLGGRRKYLAEKYAKKGMKSASHGAMTALYQMSLMEAREIGDNCKIIDNWESGAGTVTILDQETLTESALVAFSSFVSDAPQVGFFARDPGFDVEVARGRASVLVLEI